MHSKPIAASTGSRCSTVCPRGLYVYFLFHHLLLMGVTRKMRT